MFRKTTLEDMQWNYNKLFSALDLSSYTYFVSIQFFIAGRRWIVFLKFISALSLYDKHNYNGLSITGLTQSRSIENQIFPLEY